MKEMIRNNAFSSGFLGGSSLHPNFENLNRNLENTSWGYWINFLKFWQVGSCHFRVLQGESKKNLNERIIFTLPETNSSHLKHSGWFRRVSFGKAPCYVRYVRFGECKSSATKDLPDLIYTSIWTQG